MGVDMIDQMSEEIVKAVIESLPFEITVIDEKDEVIGWNRHESRIFKRPLTSMGRNFRECHPEESLAKVEALVGEMKSGKRNSARFWIELGSAGNGRARKILIEFFALRNEEGRYIGCMECTRDITDVMHLEGEKRLLD